MDNIIDIKSGVVFDDSISHYEIHAHTPYATSTYNNNDEIHIAIQHQDQYLLPCRSNLHIIGKVTNEDGSDLSPGSSLVNNAICYLFSEIRYELNAIEIDKCKNVGMTTLLKGYPSLTLNQTKYLQIAGWNNENVIDKHGNFDILLPLNILLGFAEDYQKIIVNAKHELILIRTNVDTNAIMQTAAAVTAKKGFKFTLTKIEWLMPNITLSNIKKANLLKYIEKDTPIDISFRSWEIYEYPQLPITSRHIWNVKTTSQLEKPRFIIIGFQTDRNNNILVNASNFDHCNITNIKVFLNSQYYPYGNMKLDIKNNQFALLYEMFANFQFSYYGKLSEPSLDIKTFIEKKPIIVFDCSKQNETLKYAPVDVRIEFEASENFPDKTSVFCLIIHDRIIQYKPISGDVKKLN